MQSNASHTLHGRTLRCILFDCGDTLWTISDRGTWLQQENVANQRAISLLRQYTAHEDLPLLDDEKLGNQLRTIVNELSHRARRKNPHDEPHFSEVTLDALTQSGFPRLDINIGAAIFEALRVRSSEARTLFPDALTTLATLQERGFILGVVTNRSWGGPLFIEDMRTFGLLDYFDPSCMAVSADLGIRKPNPAIFMHALDALHVAPIEAAMVGDSLSADIAGARSLGIFTIWKPSPRLIAEAKASVAPDQPYLDAPHLFSCMQRQGRHPQLSQFPALQPDLIIEQLSDLLDIFLEVGVQ